MIKIKKVADTLIISLITSVLALSSYVVAEPQIIKAIEDQITISQSVTAEISVTSPSNVTMSPAIPGMTGSGGTPSTGSATWTVITSNNTGFSMTLKSSSSPSMSGESQGGSFADYTPATPTVPDYNWAIAATAAEFGYSVEPATAAVTATIFLDNGSSACNTGSSQTTGKCWLNASTTAVTIINRTSETSSGGEAEVVKFQVEQGASTFKIEDTYTATTTVTVTTN